MFTVSQYVSGGRICVHPSRSAGLIALPAMYGQSRLSACGSPDEGLRRDVHGPGLDGLYDGGHGADQLPEPLDWPGFAGDVDAGV